MTAEPIAHCQRLKQRRLDGRSELDVVVRRVVRIEPGSAAQARAGDADVGVRTARTDVDAGAAWADSGAQAAAGEVEADAGCEADGAAEAEAHGGGSEKEATIITSSSDNCHARVRAGWLGNDRSLSLPRSTVRVFARQSDVSAHHVPRQRLVNVPGFVEGFASTIHDDAHVKSSGPGSAPWRFHASHGVPSRRSVSPPTGSAPSRRPCRQLHSDRCQPISKRPVAHLSITICAPAIHRATRC